MKLTSTWKSCLMLLLSPAVSYAIGLGEIRLYSNLNDPLDAQVPIKDTKGLELNEIIAISADPKSYKTEGLEPPAWINQVKFQVVKNPSNDSYVLKISTQQPVRDPFVDLLVEVEWPDGKLVKQFTLLLDLPKATVSPNKARALSQISTVNTQKELTTKSYQSPNKETLWSISRKLVENTQYSIQQGIYAIAHKNPEAFTNGNIHELKEGAVLQMPSPEEIGSVSKENASKFVNSGHIRPERQPSKEIASTDLPIATAKVDKSYESQSSLKLVAPISTNDLQKTDLSMVDKDKSYITQRLSLIEEAIDTLKRSNEDFSEKNKQLQEQLALKEQEIIRLKEMTKVSQRPVEQIEINYSAPKVVALENVSKETTKNVQKPIEVKKPEQIQEPLTKSKSSVGIHDTNIEFEKSTDSATKDILFMLFLLVIGGAVGGWLWFSRKSLSTLLTSFQKFKQDDAEEENYQEESLEYKEGYGLNFDLDKALAAVIVEEKKFIKPQEEVAAPKREDKVVDTQILSSLEDAEIYIAYERYPQAEKLLLDVLAKYPHQWEALLKLLELYVLTEKYNEFEQWYTVVPQNLQELSPQVWSKISALHEKVTNEMGVKIEGNEQNNQHEQESPFVNILEEKYAEPIKPLELALEQQEINKEYSPKSSLTLVDEVSTQKKSEPSPELKTDNVAEFEIKKDIEHIEYGDSKNSEKPALPELVELQDEPQVDTLKSIFKEKHQDPQSQIVLAKAFMDIGDFPASKEILIKLLPTATPENKDIVQKMLDQIDQTQPK